MNFSHYQSKLSLLSARFNLMVFLVFGLLLSNALLSSFIWQVWKHHTIEIIPYAGSPTYFKSQAAVDSHYLSLMAENFINERLNVTPETVDANHERLLSFADSSSYSKLLSQFLQEAKVIKAKKMSSTFAISQIRTNPKALKVIVSGILKRYVGLHALQEERIAYQLSFRYQYGHLSILSFTPIKEESHA